MISLLAAFTSTEADPDFWWHLRIGQWMLQHGLPRTDIFTYTVADHTWTDHEYLTEIAVALIQGWGGLLAISTFAQFNPGGHAQSKLGVQPPGEDRNRPAISVVGWIDQELIVERQRQRVIDRKRIIGFENVLALIIEPTVADQHAEPARREEVAMILRQAIGGKADAATTIDQADFAADRSCVRIRRIWARALIWTAVIRNSVDKIISRHRVVGNWRRTKDREVLLSSDRWRRGSVGDDLRLDACNFQHAARSKVVAGSAFCIQH